MAKIDSRDEYIQAVKKHDFTYEYSSDHSNWTRGVSSYAQIMYAQPKYDPDYVIWNAHAPKDMNKQPK